MSGAATIIAVLAEWGPGTTITFATIVAFLSVVDLVVGTASGSRLHNDPSKRFINLEKLIISKNNYTEQDVASFKSQRLDIEINEPPPLRVLDSICHNELLRAMGYEKSLFLKIGWFQRLTANFFDFNEHKITS